MPEMADRVRRHREILAVVEGEAIGSQDDLRRALKRRGHPVTQATLSRDLRELRVVRVPTADGYRYAPAASAGEQAAGPTGSGGSMRSMAAMEVTGLDANEVSVVVSTLPGRAQGVAVWLDALRLPEVMGTIAGDDTILVMPRTVKHTPRLKSRLADILGME
jgi:transcriptional regulator of arginine metabolism